MSGSVWFSDRQEPIHLSISGCPAWSSSLFSKLQRVWQMDFADKECLAANSKILRKNTRPKGHSRSQAAQSTRTWLGWARLEPTWLAAFTQHGSTRFLVNNPAKFTFVDSAATPPNPSFHGGKPAFSVRHVPCRAGFGLEPRWGRPQRRWHSRNARPQGFKGSESTNQNHSLRPFSHQSASSKTTQRWLCAWKVGKNWWNPQVTRGHKIWSTCC